jgi:hypothetical protein
MLFSLIRARKGSLTSYAKYSRRNLSIWIDLIKSFKDVRIDVKIDHTLTSDPQCMENYVTLKGVKEKMDALHPDLYKIYLTSISDASIDEIIDANNLESPKGWLANDLKSLYNMATPELVQLLCKGDTIINELRTSQGLSKLQRKVPDKSP